MKGRDFIYFKRSLCKPLVFVISALLILGAFLSIFGFVPPPKKAHAAGNRTISDSGGTRNWNDTASWVGGVVPIAGDDIVATATSGNLIVNVDTVNLNSFDLTNYLGTLSGANAIVVVGTAATTTVVEFAGTVTWTGILKLNPPATATINLTMGTLTTSGTCGGITIAGTTTGAVVLQDALTMGATKALTLTSGTLNTNDQTVNIGRLDSNNSNTRTLTLGASNITLTGTFDVWHLTTSGVTLSVNTSTITCTGASIRFYGGNKTTYNNVVMNGGGGIQKFHGDTFANLTITGTAVTTDNIQFDSGNTISGTLTINGNTLANRLLFFSGTLGTAKTITAAAVVLSNVDFRDITFAGAMTVTSADSIGDCGGNSGTNWASIVTAADTETWDGSTANWSSAHWVGGTVSRVPLPQDTVVLAGTNVITANMPRLGKDISFSTAARLTLGVAVTSYGSVNFTNAGTLSGYNDWFLESQARTGTLYLTSSGKTIMRSLTIAVVGATLELQDNVIVGWEFKPFNGTTNANGFNVTMQYFEMSNNAILYMGNGTWTVNNTIWNNHSSGAVYCEGSTINLANTTATAKSFIGNGRVYNNISITGGGTGSWKFSGANTFNNFTINAPKTVTFPSTVTTTINGTFTAVGSAGNIITINASTPGSFAILSKPSGTVMGDYLAISDSHAQGGAVWSAGGWNSTNVTPATNAGWIFPTTRTWNGGGGGDTNWSTAANWSDNTVPTQFDNVVFDGTSSNNVALNGDITVNNFNIDAGYGGIITSGAYTINVVNFTQAAGAFTAPTSADALNVAGNFTHTAGTFTAPA